MALTIHTLGKFLVMRGSHRVSDKEWKSQKNKNLFKILVTSSGHAVTKEQLMDWIWPNAEPSAAGRNLRVAISHVRKALEPNLERGSKSHYIITTDSGYSLNPAADIDLDVTRFEAECESLTTQLREPNSDQPLNHAEQIKALYGGPYLEEDRYEDWAISKREQVQEIYYNFLAVMSEGYAARGQYRRAISTCREILTKDPLRESACQQVMRYLYLAGDQSDAIRTYERFERNLRDQLDVEPSETIRELYHQIRQNRVPGVEEIYPVKQVDINPIPYSLSPASTPFVGRSIELDAIQTSFKESLKGTAQLTLVGGEAGVGKSRLAREWIEAESSKARMALFETISQELDQALSYTPWTRLIDQMARAMPFEVIESIDDVWLREISQISQYVQSLFPEIESNPPLPPPQQQLRLHRSVERLIHQFHASNHSQDCSVLYFDDIHWWDDDSLQLLKYLMSRKIDFPLFILGTYRIEELEKSKLSAFEDHRTCLLIRLDRLSAHELREFIGFLPFGETESDHIHDELYRETGGNPLFIISTLQHFFEENRLVVQDSHWVTQKAPAEKSSMPPSIQDAIGRRLNRLSEDQLSLLRLGSVLGTEWDLDLIQSAWERETPCLSTTLDLVDAQLIAESGKDYQFSHPKIREVVHDQMSPALSQLLHQKVLHALEEKHAGQVNLIASRLAHHALAATQWESAFTYALIATKRALNSFHLQEALNLARLGMAACNYLCTSEPENRSYSESKLEMLEQKTAVLNLLGLREEQLSDLEEMASISEELGDMTQCASTHKALGNFHILTSDFSRSIKHLEQAIDQFASLDNETERASCLALMGTALHHQGSPQDALEYLIEATQIHESMNNQLEHANSLLILGNIYFFTLAQYHEALSSFQRAHEIFTALRDPLNQAKALNNLGNVHYFSLLNYEKAIDFYSQALEIFRAVGDRFGEGMAYNNIGNVYKNIRLGKIEEADEYLWRSIETCTDTGDRVGEAISYSVLADIATTLGFYERAIELNEKTLAICEAIDLPGEKSGALYEIGRCYLYLGNYDASERFLLEALDLIREIDDERGLGFCPSVLGDLYRTQENHEKAFAFYHQAQTVQKEIGVEDDLIYTLMGIAQLFLAKGDNVQAFENSTHALQLLDAIENFQNPQEVYFIHSLTLQAMSQENESRHYLELAHLELLEIAETIREQTNRESFLNNISINQMIITAKQIIL